MEKSRILIWEITAGLFVILSGSFLHFVFALLGKWSPIALIAAVNESVWEHLKLAFWPAIIFALIQWPFFRKHNKNFWAAKTVGIFAMPIIIVSVYYTYTPLTGHHILWIDISSFALAVFSGQTISYKLLLLPRIDGNTRKLAAILLILMIAAFSLFTFFPPPFPLFCDPQTGQFGILK
jgi:hypothetical protein